MINRVSKARERALRLKEQGKCTTCKAPVDTNRDTCRTCLIKGLASSHLGSSSKWKLLRDKFLQQNGRCAYTGRELVIGENAGVDHILPRAVRPDLAKDIGNLCWVDKDINSMKHKLTAEEFINTCRLIVEYHDARA